jgi:hypothetical protein
VEQFYILKLLVIPLLNSPEKTLEISGLWWQQGHVKNQLCQSKQQMRKMRMLSCGQVEAENISSCPSVE